MHQTRRIFIMILFLIALLGAAALTANENVRAWDFRNNLWGPAHLLVTGRSPYLIEQLFTGSNSVWMPTIIGALFPLGWLPEAVATNLWLIASVLSIFPLYALAIQPVQPKSALLWTALALIGAFVFLPFVSHLVLGQFSLFAALLMLLASRYIHKENPLPAALMIVLAATKPQLVALPILGLFFFMYTQKRWKGLLSLTASCAAVSLLLLLPLWISYPNWMEGFLIALGRNPTWAHPSLFTLVRNSPLIVLWIGFTITVIGVNFVLWRRLPPQRAVVWSLALNLLITPYVWSWDFVLVLPLIFQTLFALRSFRAKSVLIGGYIVVWFGILHVRFNTSGDDVGFWWVVWGLIGGVLLAHLADRRPTVLRDSPQTT